MILTIGKKLAFGAIGAMFLVSVTSSYAEELEPSCESWTLATTFDWAGCKWSEKNGWQDQARESALDALKKGAKDKIKAVALSYLAEAIPGGGLVTAFADKQGPSELQIAVDKILNAIKISQENVLKEVNKVLITRDFASLDAFKLRVKSYMLYSEAVRKNNLSELQNLWNTSVELRNLFETHTQLLSAGETIDSMHAYISIVSLELMLRAQLTVYNYSISNEPEKINPNLIRHFQEELAEVFVNMDNIDWVKGAESFLKNRRDRVWIVGDKLGGCAHGKLKEFDYLDQRFTIRTVCSLKTGRCETDFPGGNMAQFGFTDRLYSYTSIYKANNCRPIEHPLNDDSSSVSGQGVLKTVTEKIAERFIGDVYESSYTILDQWWDMAGFSGQRPRNYADKVLIEKFADKMFLASGFYTLRNFNENRFVHSNGGSPMVDGVDGLSLSAQWILERQGEFFRIRNRQYPNQYLQLQNSVLILAPLPSDSSLAEWKLINVDDGVRIRSRNGYDKYIGASSSGFMLKNIAGVQTKDSIWLFEKLPNPPAPPAPAYANYSPTGCPFIGCVQYSINWQPVAGVTQYNWKLTGASALSTTSASQLFTYSAPTSSGGVQACNEYGCSDWTNFVRK